MYPYFKYVSKNAVRKILLDSDNKKYFTEYGLSYKFTAVKKYGLYREHVIPSSFVYKLFKDKFNKGELTIEYLLKFIPKLKLALITQEEEQYLRKVKLHSKMPSEWTEDMDPLYRYEVAGLDESIWFHYWKIC